MANVNFPSARIFSYQFDPVIVCGSFEVNAGAVLDFHGDGFTGIAHNGAGDYTVTMRHRFRHIIAVVCQLRFEAGTPNIDLVARVGVTVTGPAAVNTVDLHVTDTVVPNLADPANGNRVDFTIIYSNDGLDT